MGALSVDQARGADEAGRLRATVAVQRELMACAGDRAATLHLIAERVVEVLPAATASVVYVLGSDGRRLIPTAWAGPSGHRFAAEVRLPDSLGSAAVATGSVVSTADAAAGSGPDAAPIRSAGVRSMIVAPLSGPDGVSGVLAVAGDRVAAFDDPDEQQVALLADALSGALRHADDAARNEQLLDEARTALRQVEDSERRFAEMFDTSPVAKIVVGLRGSAFGRISVANPAFCQLLSCRPDEVLGLRLAELTSEGAATDTWLRELESGRSVRYAGESVLQCRTGARMTMIVRASLITDARGPASAVVQLLDITAERRTIDRQVRRLRDTLAVQNEVTAVAADRDAALRVVAERAVSLFAAADGAVVELLDGDRLRYEAAAGTLSSAIGTRLPVTGSLSGLVISSAEPGHCRDALVDPRVDRGACARLGIRSMLLAPLRAENTVIGVLKVASAAPGVFDDADEQQLALLAGSLSSALRHADDAARNAALLAERTRALAELEISQTRFQLAFENSPLGLALAGLGADDFGHYLQANPAMAAITGYSCDELTTMSVADLQHPDDVADTLARMRSLLAGERDTVVAERRYRHKDGHIVWVSVRAAVVRDAHGNRPYLVNQVEDITAQRTVTAQLRRQARLLDLIPAAVIVRGLDGTIDWWNTGASVLYGWPAATVVGKVTHSLLATRFPAGVTVGRLQTALSSGGVWEGQLQHLTADGRTVTVLSQQVLHHAEGDDGTGTSAQVLEINTDVTAAREAEQALAESEQRLRAHFARSAAGQIIRALDGTLTEVNPAYAAMLGYTPQQLAGRPTEELLHPDDNATTVSKIAALFAGEIDAYTHEGRLRHADGHWVDVEATMSLVRETDGRPKQLVGVVVDISARRAAERARDAAAAALAGRNTELEAANQLKLDIIGMLGHEIGNPLSSIRGYAELLGDDGPGLDEARRERAVAAIARQAGRLDEIVREVLAMVTIDAGTIKAHREELSVREQIAQALTAVDAGPLPVHGPDAVVLFNPGHLQQILVNLLSNAAKYGGGATAVRVVTDDDGAGPRVHLRVEDNGPGVPPEFRDRLFQRLARAERDARTVKGTGLGLYIVRGLARANHADIRHEPNPAGGSLFILDLETAW